MTYKLDEKILTQLQQIKNMEHVIGWLKAKLESRRDDAVALTGDNLLRAQGRAREIAELLSDIHNSQDTLKKMRK